MSTASQDAIPEGPVGAAPADTWPPAFAVGLLLILVAASAWMFSTATVSSLIPDEVFTARSIRLPFAEMLEERADRGHSPVYFSLMWCWTRAVGDSEFALRAPGIVFAALSAAVLALLVARLGGWCSGLLAALLLVLHPSFFYFGRLARPYALVLLLTLSTTLLIALMERERRPGSPVALALMTALGVLTHPSAFLVVAGQLVWCGWRHRAMNCALIALFTGTATYLPWLLFARPWDTVDRNLGWSLNEGGTAALRIVDVWHQNPGGAPVWQLILPVLAVALAVWGFRTVRGCDLRWLLLSVSVVPLVLAFVALRLEVFNLFASERYLLITVAGWSGFSAIAIGGVRGGPRATNVLRAFALAALVASMTVASVRLVTAANVTWREVMTAIDRHMEEGGYAVLLLPGLTWQERNTLEYHVLQSSCPGRVKIAFVSEGGAQGRELLLEDPLGELKVPRWAEHLVVFVRLDPPVEATRIPWISGLSDLGFGETRSLETPRGILISLSRADTVAAPHGSARNKERWPEIAWQRLFIGATP